MVGLNNPTLSALAAQNLKVGSVIYMHCAFTTPPKNKYMVVASLEPQLLVLLINTEINEYYKKQNLDIFHVEIDQENHNFLDHNSYANCIEAHTAFSLTDLKSQILTNYAQIHSGWLTDECLEQVYHAVKNNNLMRIREQKEIITSIEKQLPNLVIKLY